MSEPITYEDLGCAIDRLSAQFRASQEAAVGALTANLSELREELRR